MTATKWMIAIAASLVLPHSAAAQTVQMGNMSLGEFEYRNSCAACHGENGRGDGFLAGKLNSRPANLTMLQKDNGGVFPVERMYAYIDGTNTSGSHGARDMPIWGNRYMKRVESQPDFAFDPDDRETYTRTRILALIEFLSTLQAK